jgi:hypothetical protein
MSDITIPSGYEDDLNPEPQPQQVKVTPHSPLETLRARLATDAKNEPITLKVPNREGISVRFDTNIDSAHLDHWQKRSQRRVGGKTEPDPVKMAALLVSATCQAVLVDGQEVVLNDGTTLKIASAQMRDFLGLVDGSDTVAIARKLYGSDGHLISVGNRIVAAAGFGDGTEDVDEDEDPTRR